MRTIFSPSASTLQALALENAAEVQRYIGYVKQQECMFDALTHGADKVVQHDDGAFSFKVSREGGIHLRERGSLRVQRWYPRLHRACGRDRCERGRATAYKQRVWFLRNHNP